MRAKLFDDQRNGLWRIDVKLPCSEEKIRIIIFDEMDARQLARAINNAESVMVIPNSW